MHKTYRDILYQHKSFLIPFCVFAFAGIILSLAFSKADLFLFTNAYYSAFWDQFFKTVTWFGDGIALIAFALIMLLVRYRYSIVSIAAYAYTSVVVQILKHIFNAKRPSLYFQGIYPIRKIDGYNVHEWFSFPSGHAASALTFAAILVYILPKKYGWLVFLFFLPVSLSRVYLSQHFFHDVLAGSIIGVFLTFHIIYLLENKNWYRSPKLNRRLFDGSKSS